jgi:hypothetical protein
VIDSKKEMETIGLINFKAFFISKYGAKPRFSLEELFVGEIPKLDPTSILNKNDFISSKKKEEKEIEEEEEHEPEPEEFEEEIVKEMKDLVI